MAKITRIGAGPRMSKAVIHGDMVYLAGQVSRVEGSVTDQTRDILAQIDEILASAGTDKTKLIEATIWLADIGTFAEMNAVWDKWVVPEGGPNRACVEAKLAAPRFGIEIRVSAAV